MELIYCNIKRPLEGFEKQIKSNTKNGTISVPQTNYKGFAKINIFIGSNNSGKSRLLRNMFSNNESFLEFDLEKLDNYLFRSEYPDRLQKYYNETISNEEILDYFFKFLENDYVNSFITQDTLANNAKEISDMIYDSLLSNKSPEISKIMQSKHMFIPLLRSLHPINMSIENDSAIHCKFDYNNALRKRTEKQYFHNIGRDLSEDSIFTGQFIYESLVDMLLGDHTQRKKVRDYEAFLSENIFKDISVTLIPKKASDTVSVRLGDLERPIHELGDGIQALILLTYPIFMNKNNPMIFFIEEPELNMHPGMQRIFLNALLNLKSENHYYFFTTHSNHLVDMAFDYDNISIFMFTKRTDEENKEVFKVENVNSGDLRILRELGVNNSSVFMANCSIWVEGVTDRMYIREYLRLYQEENKCKLFTEDLHYSFVEYGGSSISHLKYNDDKNTSDEDIEIKSITNKPIIVADFDSDDKKALREKRREKLGNENYFFLEGVKEIENTLHEKILIKVIADYENKNAEEIEFNNQDDFMQENYKNRPLGIFINENLKNKKRTSYADNAIKTVEKTDGSKEKVPVDGNTIKDKKAFAEKACRYLREEDDYNNLMSESAKDLAERLYKFIEKSNEDILSV